MLTKTPTPPPHPYGTTGFDRANAKREDAAFIAAALADPNSEFLPYWRGKHLIEGAAAVRIARPAADLPWVFLGLRQSDDGDPRAVFAVDLSAEETPHQGDAYIDLRAAFGVVADADLAMLAIGRALLYWRQGARFCGRCGNACTPERAGHVMRCTSCATEHFPRTDPAVIMLIHRGRNLLLGQSHRFPKERNMFSTLAGFVEPGENLENAVRREVLEEVGVTVGNVRYHSSQPWPFPASLMLGYVGEALSEEIILEESEMRDARWFTPEEIERHAELGFGLPARDSIARRLIEDFLLSLKG